MNAVRFHEFFQGRSMTTFPRVNARNDGRSPLRSMLSRVGTGLQVKAIFSSSGEGVGQVKYFERFWMRSLDQKMLRDLKRLAWGTIRKKASSRQAASRGVRREIFKRDALARRMKTCVLAIFV